MFGNLGELEKDHPRRALESVIEPKTTPVHRRNGGRLKHVRGEQEHYPKVPFRPQVQRKHVVPLLVAPRMPLPVSSSSDGSLNIYQVKRCRRSALRRKRGNALRPQKGGPSLSTPIDTKPRVSSLLRSRWLFVSTPIRVSPRGAAHLRYTHRPSLQQHPAARPVSAPSLSLSRRKPPDACGRHGGRWCDSTHVRETSRPFASTFSAAAGFDTSIFSVVTFHSWVILTERASAGGARGRVSACRREGLHCHSSIFEIPTKTVDFLCGLEDSIV